MTSEFLTLNLSDLESLIAKGYCACHIINPNKTRIILWKEIKDGIETYYLRIGIQKFISYPLKDKNQALYWRFNCFEVKSEETITNPDPNNPIAKYEKRVAQAINHANNSNPNSS